MPEWELLPLMLVRCSRSEWSLGKNGTCVVYLQEIEALPPWNAECFPQRCGSSMTRMPRGPHSAKWLPHEFSARPSTSNLGVSVHTSTWRSNAENTQSQHFCNWCVFSHYQGFSFTITVIGTRHRPNGFYARLTLLSGIMKNIGDHC